MTKDEGGEGYVVILLEYYVIILNEKGNWTPKQCYNMISMDG